MTPSLNNCQQPPPSSKGVVTQGRGTSTSPSRNPWNASMDALGRRSPSYADVTSGRASPTMHQADAAPQTEQTPAAEPTGVAAAPQAQAGYNSDELHVLDIEKALATPTADFPDLPRTPVRAVRTGLDRRPGLHPQSPGATSPSSPLANALQKKKDKKTNKGKAKMTKRKQKLALIGIGLPPSSPPPPSPEDEDAVPQRIPSEPRKRRRTSAQLGGENDDVPADSSRLQPSPVAAPPVAHHRTANGEDEPDANHDRGLDYGLTTASILAAGGIDPTLLTDVHHPRPLRPFSVSQLEPQAGPVYLPHQLAGPAHPPRQEPRAASFAGFWRAGTQPAYRSSRPVTPSANHERPAPSFAQRWGSAIPRLPTRSSPSRASIAHRQTRTSATPTTYPQHNEPAAGPSHPTTSSTYFEVPTAGPSRLPMDPPNAAPAGLTWQIPLTRSAFELDRPDHSRAQSAMSIEQDGPPPPPPLPSTQAPSQHPFYRFRARTPAPHHEPYYRAPPAGPNGAQDFEMAGPPAPPARNLYAEPNHRQQPPPDIPRPAGPLHPIAPALPTMIPLSSVAVTPAPNGNWLPIIGGVHPFWPVDNIDRPQVNTWIGRNTPAVLVSVARQGALDGDGYTKRLAIETVLRDQGGVRNPPIINHRGENEPPHWIAVFGINDYERVSLLRRIWISTEAITIGIIDFTFDTSPFLGFWTNIHLFPDATEDGMRRSVQSALDHILYNEGEILHRFIEKDIASDGGRWRNSTLDHAYMYVRQSVRVDILRRRAPGDKIAPLARIYCEPPTANFAEWLIFRDRIRTYHFGKLNADGPAHLNITYKCKTCHAIDHPTGLCYLHAVPGWLGPKGDKSDSHDDETTRLATPGQSQQTNTSQANVERGRSRNRGPSRGRGGRGSNASRNRGR
ncbi:uncharacterized protein C8Q71DRAFT_725742 [Rhodofomes roseus]|uniref:Uncharacterized protein n=1 Tax=Rhodofomes roseus TaxID=34475 RepID=A0ABQ8K8B6_9APHY|nr:uncharacterized protein C8Q71DRAFT_725742 [Rhodofomes roseus]KAH9833543.1 hypothetical protein C8Q71DRAFT_725742 [Rhodofomes roseus]